MPVYEYKCRTCKKVSESFEKTYEGARRVILCPECGQDAYKIMSVGGFKVNGFNEANGYAGNSK